MTVFNRYLLYRIKNSLLRTLIFTVLSILITQTVLGDCIAWNKPEICNSGLYMFATMLGIFASIIPFFELAGFKNRRNLDTLYFFPIKRESMALAHYVSGFVQVVFIYTVTYVSGFSFLALNTDYFALHHMIPYYFLSLLLGLVIYSIFMFLFSRANSVADGVLFCLLWIFLLSLVTSTLFDVIDVINNRDTVELNQSSVWGVGNQLSTWGIVYAPINNLTVLYQDLIEINHPEEWNHQAHQIWEYAYMFFVWGAIGIAAAVGYFFSFAKARAEKAGEISSSWFGYRILIPIYGYCLIYNMRSGGGANTLSLISVALMIIGYVVYRRGFKFKKSDIAVMATGLLLAFVV